MSPVRIVAENTDQSCTVIAACISGRVAPTAWWLAPSGVCTVSVPTCSLPSSLSAARAAVGARVDFARASSVDDDGSVPGTHAGIGCAEEGVRMVLVAYVPDMAPAPPRCGAASRAAPAWTRPSRA